jgi:cytochrome c oxidase subunit II
MRASTPGRTGGSPKGHARGFFGARGFRIGLLAVLATLVAACSPDAVQSTFEPAGPVARQQLDLWNIVFPIAVAVFVLVQGILILAIWRFRRRSDDDDTELPKQVAGNTRLEILWTLIPAVILAGISVPTVATIFALAQEPDDALHVRVIAKQYWWEFEYLEDEGQGVVTSGQMNIPTDRPVYLHMEALSAAIPDPGGVGPKDGQAAAGVIHSFWVPRLAGKQDVFPGDVRNLTIQADEPGRYEGQCAEFCGLSHSRMRFQVIAQEPDEFEEWLASQAEPVQVGEREGLAAEGEDLFAQARCIDCHAIRGYESADGQSADIRIGPDLTHFATRDTLAGAFVENNTENLAAWLADPQAVKEGAQMPNLQLSDDEIEALVAYLQSLE